jgi:hypothetical protein
MFDFDPRDRDDDVRDVEMPWIQFRHEPGRDRESDDARDRGDLRDRDGTRANEITILAMSFSKVSNCPADSNGRS